MKGVLAMNMNNDKVLIEMLICPEDAARLSR
jgi:uncharacterized protein YbaR (Trm112 family)